MKFGGTSLAGADRLRAAADRVAEAAASERVCLVSSAMAGVADLLAQAGEPGGWGRVADLHDRFRDRHLAVVEQLRPELGLAAEGLAAALEQLTAECARMGQGVALLKECSPSVRASLSSLGDRACCAILGTLLEARGLSPRTLDPREYLVAEGDPLQARPRLETIRARFAPLLAGSERLLLLPGHFGGDPQGRVVSLGAGGGDLSAALVATALEARLLEIWTDVDGIFSADPRRVEEAFPIPELGFEEAMELAYFGAKVLHPKAVAAVRAQAIPIRVRNSFAPGHPGTLVLERVPCPPRGVRGISLRKGLALLNVSGPGLAGAPGHAAKLFTALAGKNLSVVLISQSSSELSISLCVQAVDGARAAQAIQEAFHAEWQAGLLDPIGIQDGMAILSIVGEGMRTRTGVAGGFFEAMAEVDCNIAAIAQGSSERIISAVVREGDALRALPHVHRRFFGTCEVLELYLFGPGNVGGTLLKQIQTQQPRFRELGLELRVVAIAGSRRMLLDRAGIDLGRWRQALAERGGATDLDAILTSVKTHHPSQPIFVDCTTSADLTRRYPAIFAAGLHLVTANKKANSAGLAFYQELRLGAARRQRRFLYETNVGAGLPVIDTVQNLIKTGDRVLRFEGILSGSLSFILGLLETGTALSEAVQAAKDQGFTEPDPRDDLSGMDVARKVLILAREMGHGLDLEDVQVEGLLPAGFDSGGTVAEFMARLTRLDAELRARVDQLRGEGKVLRYLGSVTADGCRVGLQPVPLSHPLAGVSGGENALAFHTERYQPYPMVIRGYGAGAEVTAAGVLSDLLRIALPRASVQAAADERP
jgi:aspartokinase/homoserine dehydrogenase 1